MLSVLLIYLGAQVIHLSSQVLFFYGDQEILPPLKYPHGVYNKLQLPYGGSPSRGHHCAVICIAQWCEDKLTMSSVSALAC